MNSIVIYASHFGNTRKIAEAIAAGLRSRGPVQVFSVEEAPTLLSEKTDLLVIGRPTEQHGMTELVGRFFERMAQGALGGTAAAAFDTRLRWPRWLSGSAAAGIAVRLRQAGARVVAPEESFFIKEVAGTAGRDTAELADGELERAAAWAAALANMLETSVPAVAGEAV